MKKMMFLWIMILLLVGLFLYIYFNKTKENEEFFIETKDVLLTPEQLEHHGIRIAETHHLSSRQKTATCLKKRLNKNYREIFSVYTKFNEDTKKGVFISPASEWLLDNFYIIETQVQSILQNLTKERCHKLSTLNREPLKGIPRIYVLALELISHTDGRVEEQLILSFLNSYQKRKPLSIAELWALPLMLSMALVEKIHEICKEMEKSQQQLRKINQWECLERDSLLETIQQYIKNMEEVSPVFIESIVRLLRKKEVEGEKIQELFKESLEKWNMDLEEIIDLSYQQQATRKISIGNSITSLHDISTLDWKEIFEKLSLVEQILQEDPAQIYHQMDFESRDYYRHYVEKISKDCRVSESFVAKKAIECAKQIKEKKEANLKEKHVGYYLLDQGKAILYNKLGKKYSGKIKKPASFYTLPIVLLTIFIVVSFSIYHYLQYWITSYEKGIGALYWSIILGIFMIVPISDMVISLQNWILTRNIPPKFIPKLEFLQGVPKEYATLVVVPTLLPDQNKVKEMIEQLEVHYLANREKNFYFAIAGDFKDAPEKDLPQDQKIIFTAQEMIKNLNKKYKEEKFFFFHRKRVYNRQQKSFMGWERKRGALLELNQLLRGEENTSYQFVIGDIQKLPYIRYIITLDADTKLPLEEGKKLVGAMAHPLNRPILDKEEKIVLEGYGFIQPRISLDIESVNKTAFGRIFAGQGGMDPYTTAVSDVYQDLFGEGIFTGKGIYDINIFQKCLKDTFPDNRILSHDLLEGSYIRTGLATDIQVIDGYPAKYSAYMKRLHRWVRGDWQIIPWLFNRVRNRKGEEIENPINNLSKWKILDNIRRSLVSITTWCLLLLGICFLKGNLFLWIGIPLITLFFPMIIGFMDYMILKYYKAPKEKLNGNMVFGFKASFYQGILRYVFLPYEVLIMLDAILRTLYRMYISKKNLLQWTTAAEVEKNLSNDFLSYLKRMKGVYGLVGAFILLTALFASNQLLLAILLSIPWMVSPWIAYKMSQEEIKQELLKQEEKETLNRLARKIWAFYEDFAGKEDHYLPPDNVQINPPNGVAHRTSPTNIGFLFMSILTARDFGFIGTSEMLDKVQKTLSTVKKLDTWKGHLYNWYDTKTLEVLHPYYISTVDSGNFISYLMTLRVGVQEYLEENLIDKSLINGLKQSLFLSGIQTDIILEKFKKQEKKKNLSLEDWKNFLKFMQDFDFTSQKERKDTYWEKKFYSDIEKYKEELERFFPKMILYQHSSIKEWDEEIEKIVERIQDHNDLRNLEKSYEKLINKLEKIDDSKREKQQLLQEVLYCQQQVQNSIREGEEAIEQIDEIIEFTDFYPLYHSKRQLFSIGYHVEQEKLTDSYYDLLASEARTTSYLSIVQNKIPKSHWFKLGRALTKVDGFRSLVSWTGTMFEYFMPALIMKTYQNTLLDETYKTAVKAQIKYGKERGVFWGTSESGYYDFDLSLNYQYKAFGVPELGLKRGLKSDMVISPYSTLLALPFAPKEAMENLYHLIENGLEGRYGLYEAVDYTSKRLPPKKSKAVVKSFMAHHQGMSIMALDNVLYEGRMQKRFHKNPVIIAGESLLQEKVPLRVILANEYKDTIEPLDREKRHLEKMEIKRMIEGLEQKLPHCHILSNGSYRVMMTNEGSGYSALEDMQVTRWREDPLLDDYGSFVFLRNVKTNEIWSNTYQPIKKKPDEYQVIFSEDKAEWIRIDGEIETHTEIIVSPEDPVEIRKITIINHASKEIELEFTSYAELVMADASADLAHPAFSNLFVRTEKMEDISAILASRRPREENSKTMWAFHSLLMEGEREEFLQYETSRYQFIGRGNSLSKAQGLYQPLQNSLGAVLDPIISLRSRIKVAAGENKSVLLITGMTQEKKQAEKLAKKYHDLWTIKQSFQLAKTKSQIQLAGLNREKKEIDLYQNMMAHILFYSPLKRKYQALLKANTKGQSNLWAYGISGDLPIVLISIQGLQEIDIIEEILGAHEYWRMKGLKVDLVILYEEEDSYYQPIQEAIKEKVLDSHQSQLLDQPGGVFIRNAYLIAQEDKILLYTVARLIFKGKEGSIRSQLQELEKESSIPLPPLKEFSQSIEKYTNLEIEEREELFFYNGYGGFTYDGSEYVIELKKDKKTPAPWINVISNPDFGFQVSESGSGFVWGENSRENKITPWSNDPVSDPPGEILYMREEEDGSIWSPTPLPIREEEEYVIRHGRGYSEFHHDSHGIDQKLTMFVPLEDTIKVNILQLYNHTNKIRKLTLTYYIKPVLGVSPEMTNRFIVTEKEKETNSLLIKNTYQSEFPGRIVALGCSETIQSFTGDNEEFIGRGDLSNPAALRREALSQNIGGGFPPCGAIQIRVTLQPGEKKNIRFLLAYAKEVQEVQRLIKYYRNIHNAKNSLEETKNYWKYLLGKIQVSTPDASIDYLLNGWLLYQAISCRLWARSAFYQSGGAYGFRDQLQDTMNLLPVFPQATREQILINSAHQFKEGDVQHWWHPGPEEKGIRTRFSDDLLWLPLAVTEYIEQTQDDSILEEKVHFLEEELLEEGQDERYGIAKISKDKASVYEHCIRAIDYSLKFGEHGIPLMGSGDWNDGMNTVGNKGKGESVWLGWFLYLILQRFSKLCYQKKDKERAEYYLETAKTIAKNLEKNAWDGNWYRRAYFDDGTPLGSIENKECMIDSLAQSWSVISGGGDPKRSRQAMRSVEQYLVKEEEGLILLFTPPFDEGDLHPGYIKGYVPGVRENGGQYTHGATWVIQALAMMGEGEKAWKYFHLINPINHSRTPMECATYKVEPYVMAADVYAVSPHIGRGGWTWYTGAAGWMYTIGMKHIIGLEVEGEKLRIHPCIPKDWKEYQIRYRYKSSLYEITVYNPKGVNYGVKDIKLEGEKIDQNYILLKEEKKHYKVEVILG